MKLVLFAAAMLLLSQFAEAYCSNDEDRRIRILQESDAQVQRERRSATQVEMNNFVTVMCSLSPMCMASAVQNGQFPGGMMQVYNNSCQRRQPCPGLWTIYENAVRAFNRCQATRTGGCTMTAMRPTCPKY